MEGKAARKSNRQAPVRVWPKTEPQLKRLKSASITLSRIWRPLIKPLWERCPRSTRAWEIGAAIIALTSLLSVFERVIGRVSSG
eukprot:2645300-Pyramimonas_sp.AAC.1